MPRAKATSKQTTTTPKKAAVKKKATPKTAAPARPPKAPARKKVSTENSLNDRVQRLEKKLDLLIVLLEHNFAKDLVKGPRDFARKMRKNNLLE